MKANGNYVEADPDSTGLRGFGRLQIPDRLAGEEHVGRQRLPMDEGLHALRRLEQALARVLRVMDGPGHATFDYPGPSLRIPAGTMEGSRQAT